MGKVSPLVDSCEYYDSEKKLGNAPAIELPNEELVIAPDIRCKTHEGKIFWIEAKDKSQRFFYPDTGADIFQVYGWYKVWSVLHQPVFVVFKDPNYDSCLPRNHVEQKWINNFKGRWDLFNGEPYGEWLSELLILENNYPKIFSERSRERPMFILYFQISLMRSNLNWENIVNQVGNDTIPNIQEQIQAYYNASLLNEDNIKEKIRSVT